MANYSMLNMKIETKLLLISFVFLAMSCSQKMDESEIFLRNRLEFSEQNAKFTQEKIGDYDIYFHNFSYYYVNHKDIQNNRSYIRHFDLSDHQMNKIDIAMRKKRHLNNILLYNLIDSLKLNIEMVQLYIDSNGLYSNLIKDKTNFFSAVGLCAKIGARKRPTAYLSR